VLPLAPAIDRVLRAVYDIDLFRPPADARGGGRVPVASTRAAWERFGLERWQSIRREFGVTEVLTYGDWTLRLPLVASSPSLRLYAIPD
jgi:hypothetical protein